MSRDNSGGASRAPTRPIPERRKEAREARGISLEMMAEVLDVSPQAVAQYETGQISPSGDAMAKIIGVTAQPHAFFTTPKANRAGAIRPFWRSLKRMDQIHRRRIARRLQWSYDIASYAEKFIELPAANLPHVEFKFDLDDEDESIERAAEAVRDHWGLARNPIRDVSHLLESHGIILVRESVDCPDMDAVSCWQGGRPFVLYSADVSSGPRVSYNLAHELGHIVLHAGVEVTDKNIDRIERQADRFAGAFLLPRERFSREVLGTSMSYFTSLKGRWGVSIAAMGYRAKELGIFNANQYSYLMRQMNAQRARVVEPLDDAFPSSPPSILAESIRMLIDHGVQTRDQVEGALAMNLRDVEQLCGVPEGYLDVRVVPMRFKPTNDA